MKCTICGKQAPSGARLCTACRAAIRRARKATVSRFQPLRPPAPDPRGPRVARRSAHGSRRQAATPSPAGTRRAPRLGRHEVVVFVALSVVACAMGLLAIRLLEEGGVGPPALATGARVVAPPPDGAPPAGEPAAPPADPQPSLAAPVRAADPAPSIDGRPAKPRLPKLAPGAWPMEDASNRTGEQATRIAAASADASAAPGGLRAAATHNATAPAPLAAAAPDPWRAMDDAIAGCSREGGLAGVLCELRVRAASCDGHWGQVPQCPAGIAGDR